MNILIPLETSSRELLYKVYLCQLLALKGFNCYLGKKGSISYLMKKMRGYICLDKGYHEKVSEKLYDQIKENKGIIINLDEEGAVDYSDNSILLSRYSEKMFSKVDFIFLWGKNQHDLVIEKTNQNNRIMVTGHPRFELLKSKYHSFYEEEVNRINNKYGDFILINTNMGFGNNIRGDNFVINNYESRLKNIQKIIVFDKKKREIFISLIHKLAKDLDKRIVLRPHPEENITYYNDEFSEIYNVNVVYEGSVIPWLIAAEIMIHPDCTTGVESLLIGKKSISYLPRNYPCALVTKLPLEASYKFTDQEEVISFLRNKTYLLEKVNLEEYEFVEESFSFSQDSSQNIVNKISQLYNSTDSDRNNDFLLKDSIVLAYKSIRSKIKFSQSVKLGRNKRMGFNYSQMKTIKQQCNKFNSVFDKVNLRRLSSELFLFHYDQ